MEFERRLGLSGRSSSKWRRSATGDSDMGSSSRLRSNHVRLQRRLGVEWPFKCKMAAERNRSTGGDCDMMGRDSSRLGQHHLPAALVGWSGSLCCCGALWAEHRVA